MFTTLLAKIFCTRIVSDELFRILYGTVSTGDLIKRGDWAEEKAKEAGQAACRLEKPPVADQVHVVLWVIKANDIRFVNDQHTVTRAIEAHQDISP